MPGSRGARLRFRAATLATSAAVAIAVLPTPAHAQNLLQSLFGALSGRSVSAPAPISVGRTDPNPWGFIDRSGGQSRAAAQNGPKNAYCVRLCDGRYFPLPRKAGAVNMSNARTCSAMCPAAETRIFNGSSIERAVAADGKRYSSTEGAFLYREKIVDDCSCRHGGASGVASMDVKNDPTLRRGDIVVTRDGPMVFTGGSHAESGERTFVRAEDYKGLPQSVRREIAAIWVAKDSSESAALPAGAAPASNEAIAATAVSYTPRGARVAPVEITPVAEAFASFIQ